MLKRLKKQVTKTLVSAGLLFSILGSTVVGAENLTPTPSVTPSVTPSTTPATTDSNNSGSNGTLISSDGTANSRLQVFIRQAAGKQVNEDSESMSTMSQQDAYFLGVYLSNFFIPYGTEFGTDEALQEENVKEAVETFKTNLNFNEDTAKSLAETIIGLSRSNNQELQFVVSKDYQDGKYEQLDDVVLSQYTLFSAMSGKLANMIQDEIPMAGLDEGYYNAAKSKEDTSDSEENDGTVVSKDWNYIQNLKITAFNPDLKTTIYDDRSGSESSNNEVPFFETADYNFETYDKEHNTKLQDKLKTFKSLKDSDDGTTETTKKMKKCAPYKYGYLAYKNGDTWIPVLDFSLYYRYGMTASQVAFWKAFESVNFEKGYGTNIFDFSQSEVDENDDYKGLKTYFSTDSDWYNMSIFGSRVVVDCFGNIMIVGKNHQFIAVPACMNPYTWQMVDENGVDDSKCKAGECYNLLNLLSMTFQDDDRMFIPSSIEGLTRSKKALNANLGTPAFKALEGRIDGDTYTARINRDTDETSLKSGPFGWGWFSTSESDALTMAKKGANAEGDYSLNAGFGGDSNTLDIFMPKYVDGTFSMSNYHKINFFDGMVFIDNLGAFHFDDSNNDLDWKLFNVEHYLNSEKEGLNKLYEKVGGTTFGSVISNIKDGAMSSVSATETNKTGIVAIYLTYVYSSLYEEDTKADTIGKLGYRMSTGIYPEIVNKPLGIDSSGEDKMSTSIKEWLYYLLNPTKGYNYVTTLISNKARALLVSWHNDMLGTKGVGNITGTTKYRGNVGYVTTPDLSDIEWTDNMLDFWNSAIPYVAIFMLVAFVFVYLAGILNLHRCIFGLIIFCICLLIPVPMINGVVGASNKVISNMYGEKFTYWAMIQHESYSKAIDDAADGDDYGNYLRTLYATNSAINVNQGSESIKLRWQAPKKMSSLMYSKKDNNALSGIRKSFIVNALTQAYSGEAYLDDDYYYLYRSYLDISNFSRYIYRGIKEKTRSHYNVLTDKNTKGLSSKLKKKLKGLSDGDEWSVYDNYRKDGYTNRTKGSSGLTNEIHVVVPVSSKIYSDAVGDRSKIANLDIDTYTGINQDYFNFSIPMFNKKDSEATEDSEAFSLRDSMTSSAKSSDFKFNKYSESDYVGLAAYGLYSESVFYYYSWVLYDQGMTPETSSTTGYKDLLLKNYKSSTNANYFYNNKGNGELKDFLDMRSLFTYIIPYLHDGNRMVTKWEETYGGLKLYDGVSSEEGQSGSYTTAEMKQKYWNNLNVARLYNVYTPWVDLMYDCNYSKPEKISVLGKEVTINDPINPSSYPAERPMIFSRSEMADYGLKEGDLTKVESLIIKCNDEFQESMFDLLNYHNFNDVVLNTAAAMNCAFIFNKNFSESGLLGTNNKEIYPQSFEISDFSYDAFLRFILANSTGESMTGSDDFYMNIVQSSSITSAIVMLILDIASMYVLPGIKIFFVILVFLASILAILVSLLHVDEEQKFITRLITSVVTPMVKYFLVTMGMAYLISLFMGVGNDSITNMHTATIQLGDPVMVMIAMLLVDVVAIILYYRIIKSVWQSVRQMGKMVGNVGTGCMVAAGGFVTGLAAGSMRGASSGGGVSSGGTGVGESGEATGVANGRASKRASSNLGSGGVANGRDIAYRGDNGEARNPGSGTRKAENHSKTKYDEAYGKKRQKAVQGKTKSGLGRLNENRRERKKVNKYMDTYFDKLDSYEKGKEKEAEDALKKEAKDKARSERQDKKRAEAKYRRELKEEANEKARRERYRESQERETARYEDRVRRQEDRVRRRNERTVSREVKRLERDANAEMRSQRREHRKRDRELHRYDGK